MLCWSGMWIRADTEPGASPGLAVLAIHQVSAILERVKTEEKSLIYTILVVEDNPEISRIVCRYLDSKGYSWSLAENGIDALELFGQMEYHIVLLDIMLPDITGFEVLDQIRDSSDVPVLFLTAKEMEEDRLKGFDLGADDYIVKPFSPRELLRRIGAIIKRVYKEAERPLYFHGLVLQKDTMSASIEGKILDLTTTEFKLLKTFMEHPDQILSRDQLISLSFGSSYEAYDRNIDTYVKKLRKKIEDNPKHPRYIHTKYGAGYVLRADS